MSEPTPVLEATIRHRLHAAMSLDLSLMLGAECGVVFGPSGAGKTTLLRLIAGLERPDSGTVRAGGATWFDSASRVDRPMRDRGVGMIFQDDLLFPHLSVEANLRFGLMRLGRDAARRRADEVAALCGVEHLRARRPMALSGGERQRVGLARALAPRPRLLLCDEPVSAIDLDGRFALIDRLREVQRAEAVPILYVTHSPAEAIALGHTLFRLEAGRIVDRGSPLEVLARRADGGGLHDVRNLLRGRVAGHAADRGETFVSLIDGPTLIVPYVGREPGEPVAVAVRADDILLARGPIVGLSARNLLPGRVRAIHSHGGDAEVVVATGGVDWIASLVGPAVAALGLAEGVEVHVILKARGCHIL